jgi:hypothetical protein
MPKVMGVHQRGSYYKYLIPDGVPTEVELEVKKEIDLLHSWNAAFEPLFTKTWIESDRKRRLGVSIIRINSLFSYMLTATTLEAFETSYDQMLPEFQEIVSLSSYVL